MFTSAVKPRLTEHLVSRIHTAVEKILTKRRTQPSGPDKLIARNLSLSVFMCVCYLYIRRIARLVAADPLT